MRKVKEHSSKEASENICHPEGVSIKPNKKALYQV